MNRNQTYKKLPFACDYMEGAHPSILKRMNETNNIPMAGYGTDEICACARQKILSACDCPGGDVYFLLGGTQTNATIISAMLQSYQGVIAANTGHISIHEAGAIEYGGHKVLELPHALGKLDATQIDEYLSTFEADGNQDHMVMPGMVYISHPTEYGTLYSKKELTDIANICNSHHISLFLDGARLAYALACPENELTLKDIASLCDVFYIGGTKCGALMGEAVVLPKKGTIPHFFTIIKQHGALLAKGWLLGIQFDTLFTDNLYLGIGEPAIKGAQRIRDALKHYGYHLFFDSPTNQIFVILDNKMLAKLEDTVSYSFWESYDEEHTVIRLATSWASSEDSINQVIAILATFSKG